MIGIPVSEFMLNRLCRKNQVEHDGSVKMKWRLTDEEFERRRDE